VWRTMGGKHRYLIGAVDAYVDDDAAAFRTATLAAFARPATLEQSVLAAEQARLETRLARFGDAVDGRDVWTTLGITDAATIPDLATADFLAAATHRESADDAR